MLRPRKKHTVYDLQQLKGKRCLTHIRDLNATILHCLGMDHNRFTFLFQGLNHKPTGVIPAEVVKGILA